MYSGQLLASMAEVEARVVELERITRAFEAAVRDVEGVMDNIEQTGTYEDVSSESLAQLEHAYNTVNFLAEQVQFMHKTLHASMSRALREVRKDDGEPLEEGDLILDGRYRIVTLLYQRPRLNLYLGRRVVPAPPQSEETPDAGVLEPLVAIRELILTDLSPTMRAQIEAAAFEEFVSPVVLGSPRLPGAGDRVRTEGERHYLVMQLRGTKHPEHALAITLEEMLLKGQQWPVWLSKDITLQWGTQLCRIVARLHRLGVILGDLDPATVLVDSQGESSWAPVLLVSWPPAPQFWTVAGHAPPEMYARIFPIAPAARNNAFVAPEMLKGIYDERSDVYSLGAILYLLLTRYAPVAAARRLDAEEEEMGVDHNAMALEGLALIPPRLFNRHITPALECVLMQALALHPLKRYPSAFALVEALEAAEVERDEYEVSSNNTSIISKIVGWFKEQYT